MPHSVFSSTGGGQKTKKRGSTERPLGPRFDHDRARPSTGEFDGYDSEDVFSVLRRPNSAGAQVPRRAYDLNNDDNKGTTSSTAADLLAVDDGDPWVDTDSVGSESDLAVHSAF